MVNQELTLKQKQDITDIFNHIFDKPLNKLSHTIRNDLILNGIEVTNNKTELKTKMGYFYEQLFCYLCNFIHPETGFDLVNEKEQIFIELKTDWNTDNYNAKESKFRFLSKYKRNNLNTKVYYICLNDKRKINVDSRQNFVPSSVPERQQEQTERSSLLCPRATLSVDYTHHFGFQIITGMKAWEFFCQRAGIETINLINYLKALVQNRLVARLLKLH